MHPRPSSSPKAAFTLVEMLTVITIIMILAGLVVGISGYVQKKGATSRAEAEIAALSTALESYKADNGGYPVNTTLATGAKILYEQLAGDANNDGTPDPALKTYFNFRPNMLSPTTGANRSVVDPYGTPYKYLSGNETTANTNNIATFDLWTTTGSSNSARWITNW